MKQVAVVLLTTFLWGVQYVPLNAQSTTTSSPAVLELEKQKAKAVSEQNFTLAGELNQQIKALKEKEIRDQQRKAAKAKELDALQKEKAAAVAKQDYTQASEIKKKIAKLTEIDELEKQKKEAVAKQDYKLAGELKKKIQKQEEIDDLEWQKKEAVAKQDYKLAGDLNKKIAALRGNQPGTTTSGQTKSIAPSGSASIAPVASSSSSSELYVKTEKSKIRNSEDNSAATIKYRRSSLYTMMLMDTSRQHANAIAKSFVDFPLPEKFNDHDLHYKVIPAVPGSDPVANIQQYMNLNAVAREVVAKWFNRSDNGAFNMDLIAERGNYNATVADLRLAALSARGNSMLADAGEDLIGNTFVVINDFKYTNKEEVANNVKTGLALINMASSLAGGPDLNNATTIASAGVTVAGKGYVVKTTSYLFRLVWNEEVAAHFYQDYWTDDSNFDAAKKNAFDNSNLFTLKYVGQESAWADLQSSAFTNKTEEELIARATYKAVDQGIAKLQRKFEEFRTKTPIFSTNPITAKIGMKEGVEKGDNFEVLEAVQDPSGKITYVRKGIIKAASVWDNRDNILELESGNPAAPATTDQYTIFKGSELFYPGMLIRQIN